MPSPKVRRRARECALQFLFGLDFTRYAWDDAMEEFWQSNPTGASARKYAESLIGGVAEHQAELDAAIENSLENWSLDRVGSVERNVIRVALFEMWRGGVPETVAINEAIEVAKRYGADDSARFVNGVLDRLKQQGRPEQTEA